MGARRKAGLGGQSGTAVQQSLSQVHREFGASLAHQSCPCSGEMAGFQHHRLHQSLKVGSSGRTCPWARQLFAANQTLKQLKAGGCLLVAGAPHTSF